MKTLGQYIRELREKHDISLRELARKINVSAAFLSDIELGRRNPSEEVLKKLAKYLNITVSELSTYDSRLPVEEMKRLANSDPSYGFAFRRILEEKISPEELMKLAEDKSKKKK